MHAIRYEAPRSVADAVRLMQADPGARILAGGTDLLVQFRAGLHRPTAFIDIKRIPELVGLRLDDAGLRLGAATAAAVICEHAEVKRLWPGLVEAVGLIGSTQIQGRGTVGGNLCNASPAADTTCALIVNRALCVIAGPAGERVLPVEEFCTAPGKTALRAGEFLVALQIPRPAARTADAYLRLIPRSEMDIAVVSAGVSVTLAPDGTCSAARPSSDRGWMRRRCRGRAPLPAPRRSPSTTSEARWPIVGGQRACSRTGLLGRPRPARGDTDVAKLHVQTTVNGEAAEFLCEPHETLLAALRNELGLTGTKEGCATGDCGACSILLDGRLVPSCLVLAAEAHDRAVTTIEGIARGDALHPLQKKFLEHAALQCGICTPGFIIAAKALLDRRPEPTEQEARLWLAGNLCRCTGYDKIIRAVLDTAAQARKTAV
jgi:carbon-monoxide dehydrogenase small subunit